VNPVTAPDAAFTRAASTWRNSVRVSENFDGGKDIFVEQAVTKEPQFRAAWRGISDQAQFNEKVVWVGNIFSHASINSRDDGLEFGIVSGDGTITRGDIQHLAHMPWDSNGYLILSGCNTGVMGMRGWCPAQEFARSQRVRTLGQTGSASFSTSWNSYTEAQPTSRNIVLWAYAKGRNAVFGSGSRMPGIVYSP
jgi:hypothetical protein